MVRRPIISNFMPFVIVILVASFFLSACNAPLSLLGGDDESPAGTEVPGDEDADSESSEFDDLPVPAHCPAEDDHAVLDIDHNIDWGVPGKGTFKVEVQGTQLINFIHSIATHEPNEQVGIYNLSTEPLKVKVSALGFEDCNDGTAETTMRVVVQGTCFDGILTLYIKEIYAGTSVTMMCGTDRDDEVEIPLPFSTTLKPVEWIMNITDAYTSVQELPISLMGQGATGLRLYKLTLAYTP